MPEYSKDDDEGIRLLQIAMIKQAVQDLANCPVDSEAYKDAFVFADDPSFDELCELVGLDPDEVNQRIDDIISSRKTYVS